MISRYNLILYILFVDFKNIQHHDLNLILSYQASQPISYFLLSSFLKTNSLTQLSTKIGPLRLLLFFLVVSSYVISVRFTISLFHPQRLVGCVPPSYVVCHQIPLYGSYVRMQLFAGVPLKKESLVYFCSAYSSSPAQMQVGYTPRKI